ncbi:MAG TPA: replication initiation protein [Gammaproteobacteria bacterium]|jgi:hypothetical protein|nr:replication initiation protein [Gammaproteobacteria bacterium]
MDTKKRKKKGNLIVEKDTDIYLKKHVGLIHCENKLTLIQRKICNILLFNALDKINHQEIHEIQLKQLCSLVGYNSHDTKLIKDAIKSLISTVLEWNLLEDLKFLNQEDYPEDIITWNASSLLAGASIRNGIINYSYSPQIKPVLSSLDVYGRINLFVQAKFKSNYSLVLYENCVRFKNLKQTAWFPLSLFRSLMGVKEDKYLAFKEFKRNVITTAVKEVNQKSDIFIEPEFKKVGRNIAAVQFMITENQNYQPSFRKPSQLVVKKNSEKQESTLLEILISEYGISKRQVEEILKKYEYQYIIQKIKLVKNRKNIKNTGAYLISALHKDYQENEAKKKQVKKIPLENTSVRESKAASEIIPLKNKYMSYKLKAYTGFIEQQADKVQKKIHKKFIEYLKPKSQIYKTYQKKKLTSPFVITEFLIFLENHFSEIIGEYLTFDDYLTSEM